MKVWNKMCANTNGLQEELMTCRGRYILDNVRMPDTCGGKVCTIEFRYYNENLIVLSCIEAPIEYNGSNAEIGEWLNRGSKEFDSYESLDEFLGSFVTDTFCAEAEGNRPNDEGVHNRNGELPPHGIPRSTTISQNTENSLYDKNNITIPDNKTFIELDKNRLIDDMSKEIKGQDENLQKIAHLVTSHLGIKKRSRPISVFLYGPPGTGKSTAAEQLVKSMNKQLAPKDRFCYRSVDCTQFQERADISRLTGAAPGYVGYDEPGVFSVLEDNPNTVFVFEDLDKAANNVTEVIMQAMENGRQETNGKTLSNGKNYYDLSRSIIFFTSNIELSDRKKVGFGSADISADVSAEIVGESISQKISRETREAKEKMLGASAFRREVISRMTAVIKFDALSGDAIKDIAVKCICNTADSCCLNVVRIDTPILQEFINATVSSDGIDVRMIRIEASNYFSMVMSDYSHMHENGADIVLSGSLYAPVITAAG